MRLLDDFINGVWEFVVLALGCLLLVACLSGCGWDSRSETAGTRQTRTITREVRQEINPATGEIVELRKTISATVDEETGQTTSEKVEVEPPKVVGALGALARAAGTAMAGPAAGEAAKGAVDWLSTLLTGGAGAATAAGTGWAALHRPAQARRRRLEEELEAEREEREAKEKALRQVVKGVDAWKESRTEKDDAARDLLRVLKESTDEDARLTIKQAKAQV